MRTRDELFDALDRLPRPVCMRELTNNPGLVVFPESGGYSIISIDPAENVVMREYFNALPAEEKGA